MVGGKFEASLGALLCCCVVVLCWERCRVGNVVVLLCAAKVDDKRNKIRNISQVQAFSPLQSFVCLN